MMSEFQKNRLEKVAVSSLSMDASRGVALGIYLNDLYLNYDGELRNYFMSSGIR